MDVVYGWRMREVLEAAVSGLPPEERLPVLHAVEALRPFDVRVRDRLRSIGVAAEEMDETLDTLRSIMG